MGEQVYTVLVADDEIRLLDAVCRRTPWEELGFRLVARASTGLDALQLADELEPDLVITDIRMPFITGIELAEQLRRTHPQINIVFLSGYDDFEYARKGIEYDVISYLLKPLSEEEFMAELKKIHSKLDAQAARREQAPLPRRSEPDSSGGSSELCRKALEAIYGRYMEEDLSLVSLSEELHVSPNHLSVLLKKATGDTFLNLLIARRMQIARELLSGTDMKVYEIASRCGYTDQHYFSYCFKKYCGCTPLQLRSAGKTEEHP